MADSAKRTTYRYGCDVDGCERPHDSRGYCKMHAKRYRRTGTPTPPPRAVRRCSVANCGRKHYAHGFCSAHWQRWKRHADAGAHAIGAAPTSPDGLLACSQCERRLAPTAFSPLPKKRRGYTSACRECLREQAREHQRRRRARDPEGERAKWNAWVRTPAGRAYVLKHNGRRRGAYDCAATREFAATVLAADPCAYCGEAGGTIDHIDALIDGGGGSDDNLTGACFDCNRRKNRLPLLQFLLRQRERHVAV